MKSSILFIGYDPSLHDEIREFIKDRRSTAHFSGPVHETIRIMDSKQFDLVVLTMNRLEDAAILRYINLNYRDTKVLIRPGKSLEDAIPALATGHFDILAEPFKLEELGKFIKGKV